jgi:hypothetical protein
MSPLTKLRRVDVHDRVNRVLDVSEQDISFHFVEGGEAIKLKPDMDARQVVFELRRVADRIERRSK